MATIRSGAQYTGVISGTVSATNTVTGSIIETFLKGLSAYEVAVKNGYSGTEIEWLQSLVGDTVDLRINGTILEWKHSSDEDWTELIDLRTTSEPVIFVDELPQSNIDPSKLYILREDDDI